MPTTRYGSNVNKSKVARGAGRLFEKEGGFHWSVRSTVVSSFRVHALLPDYVDRYIIDTYVSVSCILVENSCFSISAHAGGNA